jgi:hypothetical protein
MHRIPDILMWLLVAFILAAMVFPLVYFFP